MTRDFIISKEDKDRFYEMIIDKHILGLHGGIIGDYNDKEHWITLLDEWVPYLDEYKISYREVTRYLDGNEVKVR
jgi:hypothetical protein